LGWQRLALDMQIDEEHKESILKEV